MHPKVRTWRDSNGGYPNAGNQIYLHVPFCPFLCHFCPLYKVRLGRAEEHAAKDVFVDSLLAEIELYGASAALAQVTFDAVYFGGGTPTELRPEQLGRILDALRRNFRIAPDAEITLEGMARQMIADDYVERALDRGFNRFSWGVQSLDPVQRKRIGRGDQVEDYTTLLRRIRAASPTSAVNCEIMAGLPEQTFEQYARDLDTLLSWNMSSLDVLYYVPLPGTKLQSFVEQRRREAPLFGANLLRIREYTNRRLLSRGYRQATGEVFVRDERNLFVPTGFGGGGHGLNTHLALGPSAFGQIEGTVYQNVCDLDRWHGAIARRLFPLARAQTLTPEAALRRAALLSVLRLHLPTFLVRGPRMRNLVWRWRRRGLVRRDGVEWRLTEKGALWYNQMQVDILTIPDLLDLLPMFGSSESLRTKLRSTCAAPDSEAHELQRLIRGRIPFSRTRELPYRAALRAIDLIVQQGDAIGFTGPMSGRAPTPWEVARRLLKGARLA
jgi:oxygen-independent coproporphyrinogen-3 oxidase